MGAIIRLPLVGLSLLLNLLCCSAGTSSWTGSVSSDWFAPNNWSPFGVPGAGDTINVTNGTINLSSPVTISGVFNWFGGSLSGNGMTITSAGVMNIVSNFGYLNNLLTNAGTVTMSGSGTLYVENNNTATYHGGVYNLPGALWDLQTNTSIYNAGYGYEFFNNAGNFRKSVSSSAASIGVMFTNTGTVTNLIGALSFSGGGTLAGSYNTAAGAAIYFAGGNFSMGVPPAISGPGLCEFTGATLTLTEDVPANLVLAAGSLVLGPAFQNSGGITNLTLSGSTLTGTNTVTGTFIVDGGRLSGPLTIENGGVLNISSNMTYLDSLLTNAGTVTMIGNSTLYVENNNTATYHGGVYNLPGALWDIQTNSAIYNAGYGYEFFNNSGNLRKSLGSGTAAIYVPFTNSGTVTNLLGNLSFYGGGTLTGAYNTAGGATTDFAAGSFSMGVPPAISGPGLCEFTGATLTLTEDVPANLVLAGGSLVLGPAFQNSGGITNLTLSGSTLTGTNTVTGTFIVDGGRLSGSLTFENGGVLNIPSNMTYLDSLLTNAGTVTMTGNGTLYVENNNTATYHGGVYNLPGALWDIQTNSAIYNAGYGYEFFNNAGNLRKSVSSGAAAIYVSFANTGTVTNLIGALNFSGGGTLAGSYNTAAGAATYFAAGSFSMGVPPAISGPGLCEFTGATLTLTEDVPANLVLAGGSLVLGPAFQNSGGITNLTLNGATLTGTNTVTGTFSVDGGRLSGPLTVENGGVLNISSNMTYLDSLLTNAGTVTMTGNSTLYVENNNNATYHGGVYNLPGALWDIQTNSAIYNAGYGYEFFNNAGNLRKSLGSGTASIFVSFANTGTVTNLIGALNFSGGGTLAGSYNTAVGASIYFAAGIFNMGLPPVIIGSGLCEFTGATLTLTEDVPTNLVLAGGSLVLGPAFQNSGGITNLTLSGATLTGTNTVTGTFIVDGGRLSGPLTIENGGALNIPSNMTYLDSLLTNAGTVTMTGNGTLYVENNNTAAYHGGVYNLPGALWDIQTNSAIYNAGYGYEFFNNAGNLRKSVSSGTASIYIPFTNTGTVNAHAGTLGFYNSFSTSGGTLVFGVSGLAGIGQINVAASVALNGVASVAWLNGFIPAVGNSFGLLNYGSHSGTFAGITLPPGTFGQGNYGATVFSLLITNVTAQAGAPSLSIAPGNPGTVLVSWPTNASTYGLQTITNLSLASWSNITTGIVMVGTNFVHTNTANAKAAFFRLMSP